MIKKVLLFLAIFGVGLGLLRLGEWLGIERTETPGTERPPERVDEPAVQSESTLRPSGAFAYDQFTPRPGRNSWPQELGLRADDSRVLPDGGMELRDVRVRLFDVERETLFARLEAVTAQFDLERGGDEFLPEVPRYLEFVEFRATLLDGTKLVPLVLEAPTMEGDLEALQFETDDRAVIRGTGLSASGTGFFYDAEAGLLRFDRDAIAQVEGDDVVPARLGSQGALELRRVEEADGERLQLVADGGAVLGIEAETPLTLEARRIVLSGRPNTAAGAPLRFDRLEAVGEVVLVFEGGEFRGQHADFTLREDGQLEDASLSGSPTGWLLVGGGLPLGAEPSESEPMRIDVWGDGPLTLGFEPAPSFAMAGAALLRWQDAELWAQNGVSGSYAAGDEDASFRAWGGVTLDLPGWQVRTTELDGRVGGDELEFDARGLSRVETVAGAEQQPVLVAREGFRFHFDGERWRVPIARGVALELTGDEPLSGDERHTGDEPLTGTTDVLRDFDPLLRTFVAEGNVEVLQGDLLLRGHRLTSRGPGSTRLDGRPGEPVTFDSPQGTIRAAWFDRRGTVLAAYDDVVAQLPLEGRTIDVRARKVRVDGFVEGETRLGDGPVELIAEGNVVAELEAAAEHSRVESEWLRVLRAPSADRATFTTDVLARGRVVSELATDRGAYRVRADEVEGRFVDAAAAAPEDEAERDALVDAAEGRLEARGAVTLQSLREPRFEARGDRLTLERDGSGELLPRIDERVVARGTLPEAELPFELEADALRFDPEHLEADRPDLSIVAEGEAIGGFERVDANAGWLHVSDAGVDLRGDVDVVARTEQDERWTLESGRVELQAAPHAGDGPPSIRLLRATEAVRVVVHGGFSATGELLTAEPEIGRVRVEGAPASVVLPFLRASSEHFELERTWLRGNPIYMFSQSGGTILPPRPADRERPR